jgi:acetylglutamate kinase
VTPTLLKVGGELLEPPGPLAAVARVIAEADSPLVVVHGGGREIDAAMARAGIPKRQVDGLRITDAATLDVVVEVLAGAVNTRFVAAIIRAGARAVGLTGADASLVQVEKAPPHRAAHGTEVDLGRVGRPVGHARPGLAADLLAGGYVPVVASIALGQDGLLYNVNADTFAAHLAVRLGAQRLVVAGATPGVLGREGRTIPTLDLRAADALVASGVASAGMIAKLRASRDAIEGGVEEVILVDGRDAGNLAAALGGWSEDLPATLITRGRV